MLVDFKNTQVEFPDSITVGEREYCIEVKILDKRSSSVTVKEESLQFRMSRYLSKKQLQLDFGDLLRKISRKIERSPTQSPTKTFSQVMKEGKFTFAGDQYYIITTPERKAITINENCFLISPNSDPELVKKRISNHLKAKYFIRMKEYLHSLNARTYNYPLAGFELKIVDSKWGHCSHDNIIMLNLKLLNAPIEILNYVIFHELAHIKHKNHSQAFWREVSRFCPEHKKFRKYLKDNPPTLFN